MGLEGGFWDKVKKATTEATRAAAIAIPALSSVPAQGQEEPLPWAPKVEIGTEARDAVAKEFIKNIEMGRPRLLHDLQSYTHTSEELLDVVYASKLTVPWNSLYGTVLDPHFLEKKTAMLSAEEDGPAELSGTQTKRDAEILEYSDDTEGRLRQYGQGIVVGKGEGSDRKQHALILSNRHVIDGLALNTPGISIRYDKQNRDLAIALFPHVQVDPEAMVRLPEHLSDNKIKGQFIVLTGIKPDVTSVGHGAGSEESGASVTGRKTYGGIAIHLNHQLIEALFPRMPTEAEMTQLLQSFIVEVPTSQSLDNEGHAHHITEATFRGMSGSPVFVFLNGKYHFCGVIASIFQKIDTRGQVHSFAVFYGPDAVNAFFRDSTPSTLEGVFGPDKVSAVPPQPQTQNDPGSQNQD